MSVTKPLPAPPLTTLHVIPHLRWEREWVETFDSRRAWLLDTLARLLEQMDSTATPGTALRFFLLGGQTVILEDIAAVRPDLLALLVIFNAGGRLGIGPFYVTVDDLLVSGESMLRNLMTARADAIRHGVKLMPVAYMPQLSGHGGQLPQILRGVGITAAFLYTDELDFHEPFRWEGTDGSNLLVVNHPPVGYTNQDLESTLKKQQAMRPDGPFLWLLDSDSLRATPTETLNELEMISGVPVEQSDLPDYLRSLRRSLPDSRRKPMTGELSITADGTHSARLYLKQNNARLQANLTYAAEPWLALALTHGKVKHPDNLRALLNYGWRLALQNQVRTALGGCSIDAVHEENEIRYRQAMDTVNQIVKGALTALPGHLYQPGTPATGNLHIATYVVVWNPHNWPVKQVVEVPLNLPPGHYPAKVRAPGSEEQNFSWSPPDNEAPHSGTVAFLAEVPAVGYATYTIELSDTLPDSSHLPRLTSGRAIGSVSGDTLTVEEGRLKWHTEGESISGLTIYDLLNFYDGGDAGDTFTYAAPEQDVIAQGQLVDDVKIESSPLYERLILHHRMRVATALRTDRVRERGVRLLEITTTVTFYDHVPGLYFRTTFNNTARDHRLRIHLRTGLETDLLLSNSLYGLVERPASGLQPIQTACTVEEDEKAVTLLARGLPEVEPISEDGQLSLALTLTRAVGWLNRDDIEARPDSMGPSLAVPGAQCQRIIESDYALLPTAPNDPSAVIRAAHEFDAPLQAYQYDARPERPRRSFLSIVSDRGVGGDSDGNGAILTAFKPPQKGKGWIVRLLNPSNRSTEVLLTPHVRPEHVQLVNLAEESQSYIETDANGRVTVMIEPHQLVTLKLTFE